MSTTLKNLTPLCVLLVLNSFSAQPAMPSLLQARCATIDTIPDYGILCAIVPEPQDVAQQGLMESRNIFKAQHSAFMNLQAKHDRALHKYWTIHKELSLSNDESYQQSLQEQLDYLKFQCSANQEEMGKTIDCLATRKMVPFSTFCFIAAKCEIHSYQASILLDQKEKLQEENMQLKKEKTQWQEKEKSLLAQLKGYQLLEQRK